MLQVPQRAQVCPHLRSKKTQVDVPIIVIKTGLWYVSVCLSELVSLRIEAQEQLEKINQQGFLTPMGKKLSLREKD
jgi:DNA-binding PucR family transcriptional regulator